MPEQTSQPRIPITAQVLRLQSAIKKSGREILSISVDSYGIDLYVDWEYLHAVFSGHPDLVYSSMGDSVKAQIESNGIRFWASQTLTIEEMKRAIEGRNER